MSLMSVSEKIPTKIFETSEAASVFVANEIALLIKKKQSEGKPCVLGLATGSTPTRVYAELVSLHKKGLSFKNVITFNLDEYFPINPGSLQSYVRFMKEHLFNHIDIPKKNINIPDGTLKKEKVQDYCIQYEKKIESLGGSVKTIYNNRVALRYLLKVKKRKQSEKRTKSVYKWLSVDYVYHLKLYEAEKCPPTKHF